MASRDPKDLHPILQEKWVLLHQLFIAKFPGRALDLILTCTYRAPEEQALLYGIGRTKPGKIVTNARPGQSKHNHKPALAFDCAIIENGKCNWMLGSQPWQQYGALGESIGLEWGGHWRTFPEGPHMELPDLVIKSLGITTWPMKVN